MSASEMTTQAKREYVERAGLHLNRKPVNGLLPPAHRNRARKRMAMTGRFEPYRANNVARWNPDPGILLHSDVGGLFVSIEDYNKLDLRISELEAQLAALTWKEISESNLPKAGDELLDAKHNRVYQMPEGYAPMIPMAEDFTIAGWTHFRAINPPSPERGANG